MVQAALDIDDGDDQRARHHIASEALHRCRQRRDALRHAWPEEFPTPPPRADRYLPALQLMRVKSRMMPWSEAGDKLAALERWYEHSQTVQLKLRSPSFGDASRPFGAAGWITTRSRRQRRGVSSAGPRASSATHSREIWRSQKISLKVRTRPRADDWLGIRFPAVHAGAPKQAAGESKAESKGDTKTRVKLEDWAPSAEFVSALASEAATACDVAAKLLVQNGYVSWDGNSQFVRLAARARFLSRCVANLRSSVLHTAGKSEAKEGAVVDQGEFACILCRAAEAVSSMRHWLQMPCEPPMKSSLGS